MKSIRKPHVLKSNKECESWSKLLFFDTETKRTPIGEGVWQDTFKLGWACYVDTTRGQETWQYCESPESVWQFIEWHAYEKHTLYVLAHNLYYDFTICHLQGFLAEHGWTRGQTYIPHGGLSFFLEARKGKRRILFCDTMNFFQVGLATLGKKIGEYKGIVDFATATDQELSDYCKQDTNIIKVAIIGLLTMVRQENLGNMQKTLASLSFTSYRHRFMPHPIFIHANPYANRLERDAYHGGRVEVFKVGMTYTPLYKLDVNSMYPFLMRDNLYPHKLLGHSVEDFDPPALLPYLDKYYCLARCVVETEQENYPYKLNDRLVYPVGRFETVLGSSALRLALLRGHLVSVKEIAVYEQAMLFKEYITYFWERRKAAQQEGNEAYSYFYKILMNAMHGKFGQRQNRILSSTPCDPDLFYSARCSYLGTAANVTAFLGTLTISEKEEKESYNSFPAISAAITENSRLYLLYLMELAGLDHLWYIDTDSLVVDEIGYERLFHLCGTELGQLKLEGTSHRSSFYAPKDYVFGDEDKKKGIRKEAIYSQETDRYRQEQWQRIRGALRDEKPDTYTVRLIEKHLAREVKARKPLPGGGTEALRVGQKGDKYVDQSEL